LARWLAAAWQASAFGHHLIFLNPGLLGSRQIEQGLQGTARYVGRQAARRLDPAGFSVERSPMSLSSAKNYALRAERSQDPKEAADLLAKAILELAASIEATDAKVKKINKSAG
jgi:hypothetical protein